MRLDQLLHEIGDAFALGEDVVSVGDAGQISRRNRPVGGESVTKIELCLKPAPVLSNVKSVEEAIVKAEPSRSD